MRAAQSYRPSRDPIRGAEGDERVRCTRMLGGSFVHFTGGRFETNRVSPALHPDASAALARLRAILRVPSGDENATHSPAATSPNALPRRTSKVPSWHRT